MIRLNIILCLLIIVVLGCSKNSESFEAKVDSNVRNFKLACKLFKKETGQQLDLNNLDEVVSLLNGNNSKKKIFFVGKFIDPNGNPYLYVSDNIVSKGKDGVINSEDDLVYPISP